MNDRTSLPGPPAPQSPATRSPSAPRVRCSVVGVPDGPSQGFALSCGTDSVRCEPGRSWLQTDHFKWVTRGLIEPPQSFVVHPDGSVDLNAETFRPEIPEHVSALEEMLNRRHAPTKAAPTVEGSKSASPPVASQRVEFRVHLDALSHLLVQATRAGERVETGLRGLNHLVSDGWMVAPREIHVDPLQRFVEIDGYRFEATAMGAEELQTLLNHHFVPANLGPAQASIEIRENVAASTGFDIHFWISRAGTAFEVRGHLSQDKLDILQDHERCDLLRPGILLRLSPPYLYFRRRRPDGGEEHVPDFPDVKYRGISAPELQRLFNDPRIRQGGSDQPAAAADPAVNGSDTTVSLAPPSPSSAPKPAEPVPAAPTASAPPSAGGAASPPASSHPLPPRDPPASPPRVSLTANSATATEILSPELARRFESEDAHHVHESIFRHVIEELGLPVQDILLSLPRVFENRRFEIASFEEAEVSSVLQLRGAEFYGMYLSHLGPERIDFVYACRGLHLEWGTEKCAVQTAIGAETLEFSGNALRGLAQDAEHHFVFVVDPRYRAWIAPQEAACAAALAHFVTPEEWGRRPAELPLFWPPETAG